MSIGFPIEQPTPTYEENAATIAQVNKDHIALQARPVAILISSLHEHQLRGTFTISSCKTALMLADFLSKPTEGDTLMDKVLWAVGHRFYPPKDTEHYLLLQLDKYPIGIIGPLPLQR